MTTGSCVQGQLRGQNGQLKKNNPGLRRLIGKTLEKAAIKKIFEGHFNLRVPFMAYVGLYNHDDLTNISPLIVKSLNAQREGGYL